MHYDPITFDREWLTFDMDITEADLDRLAALDEQTVNRAIQEEPDDEFWSIANDLRTRTINRLLGTTY